ALQAEGWSEAELSAMQQLWEEHDLIAAVAVGLQGDRPLPLVCLSMYREHHERARAAASKFSGIKDPALPLNYGWGFFYRNLALPNDALYGLRHMQREVELARE